MDTRSEIIQLAESYIRARGYNAFSFSDIAGKLGIKNASVHYHFPTKTSLGKAVISLHVDRLMELKSRVHDKSPLEKLAAFFDIYDTAKAQNKVCLVGSLATDLYTVDAGLQKDLRKLVNEILKWVTAILEEGKTKKVFFFEGESRTKALMVITNMLASVQLIRLTSKQDFKKIKESIIHDLTTK